MTWGCKELRRGLVVCSAGMVSAEGVAALAFFRLERIVAAPLSPLRKLGIVWCGVLGLLEWMVGSIDLKVEVAPRERCRYVSLTHASAASRQFQKQ